MTADFIFSNMLTQRNYNTLVLKVNLTAYQFHMTGLSHNRELEFIAGSVAGKAIFQFVLGIQFR